MFSEIIAMIRRGKGGVQRRQGFANHLAHAGTGVNGRSPRNTAITFAAAVSAIFRRVDSVADPMCGSRTTLGSSKKSREMRGSF